MPMSYVCVCKPSPLLQIGIHPNYSAQLLPHTALTQCACHGLICFKNAIWLFVNTVLGPENTPLYDRRRRTLWSLTAASR